MRLHRRPIVFISALFVLLALAYWPFKIDDAYISFVYAKNLIQGHGLTYNGVWVEGYSNFLWTILMAPVIALGGEPLTMARVISLMCSVATLFLTNRLIEISVPGITTGVRSLALMAVAVNVSFMAWTLGGLETALMTLEVILFVYCELHPNEQMRRWSPLVVLACALTRPEGAMLFPILLVYRRLYRLQPLGQMMRQSLAFVLPFGTFLLWRYLTYGEWVPNTALVKLNAALQTVEMAARWLLAYLELRPLVAVLMVLGVFMGLRRGLWRQRNWSLMLMVAGAFIAFVLYAGPDWMPHYRFLMPIIPLSGIVMALAFSDLHSVVGRRIAVSMGVGAIAFELILAFTMVIPQTPLFGDYTDGLVRAGQWIHQNTTPQDVIAVVDAGALAYYSERRTLDIIGLNDAHVAHTARRSDAAYILAQRPKIIQLHVEFSRATGVVPPDKADNNRDIFYAPDFQQAYEPYWAGTQDPFFPFLFVRRVD